MRDMSPAIEPVRYHRGKGKGTITRPIEYTFDGFDDTRVHRHGRLVKHGEGWLQYYGDLGDVFISDGHAHVPEPVYRMHNMIILREYVYSVLDSLAELGIIEGWQEA